MSSYIFIYRAGPDPIPEDKVQENRQAWRAWSINLQEKYGIHASTGKVVTSDGIAHDYAGDFRGASLVEIESLEAAVEIAKKAPNLAYGGSVEVLEEYQRPR
jgi:YCII-related domain-containing protein